MECEMIIKIADNIVSPLGFTTVANYEAVKAGQSRLRYYECVNDIPEPFTASLFDWEEVESEWTVQAELYTRFEKIVIMSVENALQQTDIDISSSRVLIIISTIKGNVELIDSRSETFSADRAMLGVTAKIISDYFENPNPPIVVSNACISGLCAQIAAMRALQSGKYDYVVVAGADVQSRFIISGFQSFKALSPEECKPFDIDRCGLNLGEAAATIIYGRSELMGNQWIAASGAIRNDAYHISGVSRTAEGSYRALRSVLGGVDVDDLALVNVHGTSTLYNDEMESKALARAGLKDVPVNTLKGFYGHTMGAAGILEVILSMASIDDKMILATRGYSECGVSQPLNISNENRDTDKRSFVKLLSGFGGCNAAMLFKKGGMQ